MMRQVITIIYKLLFYLFRIFRIKNNKIVFVSYLGKGYGDNGKYIAEELLARNENLDIVWLCRDMDSVFPKGIRKVRYNSLRSVYELVTARVWVDNKRKPVYVRKRAGQYYIMTWHADSVLKKVEKDAETKLPKYYVEAAKNDSKMADLFLSSCAWETSLYRSAFWYKGEIMEVGYPRQDILFNYDKADVKAVKKELGIPEDTNVVMYAPTFRNKMTGNDLDIYDLNWKKMLEEFSRRFGGKWIGLIRLHPNVAKLSGKLKLPDNVIDVSKIPDVQRLIIICDCLITDYSSIIIEAALARKIGITYAKDYDEYKKDRDTYFEMEEFPFPFSESQEELFAIIEDFDKEKYYDDLNDFLNNMLKLKNNGNSSKSVSDRILNVINKK